MVKLCLKVYASAALCACAFLLLVFITSKSKASANGPDFFLDYVEPDHVVVVGATARRDMINDHFSIADNTPALSTGLRVLGHKYKIVSVTPITAEAYHSNPTIALIVFVAPKDSK